MEDVLDVLSSSFDDITDHPTQFMVTFLKETPPDTPRLMMRKLTRILRDEHVVGEPAVLLSHIANFLVFAGSEVCMGIKLPEGEGWIPSTIINFHQHMCSSLPTPGSSTSDSSCSLDPVTIAHSGLIGTFRCTVVSHLGRAFTLIYGFCRQESFVFASQTDVLESDHPLRRAVEPHLHPSDEHCQQREVREGVQH